MHSAIKELARKEHAFFLYDADIIKKQISSLKALPANVDVFYAMKANPHDEIVRFALNSNILSGIEIASRGEAEKVLGHSNFLDKVIYTGPSKRPDELSFVLNRDIQLINMESLTEAYRIQELARTPQQALLRVNANREIHGAATQMSSTNKPSAFGVLEEYAPEVIKQIKKLDKLNLAGIHIFSASGVLDAKILLDHIDYSFTLIKSLESETRSKFSTIDFGGGFGIDYSGHRIFDIDTFSSGLEELIGKHSMQDKRLILELGRYIVADSGYFCTKINDIKLSRGKKVIICTAGINAHKRPSVMKIEYPIDILPIEEKIIYPGQLICDHETVEIRGPICSEADYQSVNAFVPHAEIGDFVVMGKSGAYGLTMSQIEFLSHPRVKEVVFGGKNE